MSPSTAGKSGRFIHVVPAWISVVAAGATIVGTTGAAYATFGLRLTTLESRADRTDLERNKRNEEFEQLKQRLAAELQALKDGQQQQAKTLSKIADRLGVIL
jgi:membrane protein involved in colicin uptake